MIGVLRRRDFALLWWGGLVSVAGDSMLLAVLPYVVYASTGSTLATAGMTVAELVPGIVLGSVAGVFVDRWDRRRVLVLSNVLQAVTVAALLVLAREPDLLAVVYVVAALQSSLSAFSLPAESSLLPTLVPEEDLVAANALNVLNNRVGRLAGLPLGAVVYAGPGSAPWWPWTSRASWSPPVSWRCSRVRPSVPAAPSGERRRVRRVRRCGRGCGRSAPSGSTAWPWSGGTARSGCCSSSSA